MVGSGHGGGDGRADIHSLVRNGQGLTIVLNRGDDVGLAANGGDLLHPVGDLLQRRLGGVVRRDLLRQVLERRQFCQSVFIVSHVQFLHKIYLCQDSKHCRSRASRASYSSTPMMGIAQSMGMCIFLG